MLTPYLTFNGNTEEAFNFYAAALGGSITILQRFGDTEQGAQLPEAAKNKIMHITLRAPGGITLMASDHMDFTGQAFIAGNNFSLSIHPDSVEKADTLFAALAADGTVTLPMEKVFWGSYFGMLVDKFGVQWMINHDMSKG
jgi:PhnB protein